jgi:hypothetical protein
LPSHPASKWLEDCLHEYGKEFALFSVFRVGLHSGGYVQEQEWKQVHAKAAEVVMAEMPNIPDTSLEECIVRTVFVRGACQMVAQLEVPSDKTIEVVTARVFLADAAVALGHNALITRQREISRQLGPSVFVPMTGGVLRSCGACAEVLVTNGSATLSQLLASAPLDVASTQFLVAGIIVRPLCSTFVCPLVCACASNEGLCGAAGTGGASPQHNCLQRPLSTIAADFTCWLSSAGRFALRQDAHLTNLHSVWRT